MFDSMLESRPRIEFLSSKARWNWSMALAAHLAIIGALAVAAFWTVSDLMNDPRPPISAVLLPVRIELPQQQTESRQERPRRPRTTLSVAPQQPPTVQPEPVPAEIPQATADPTPSESDGQSGTGEAPSDVEGSSGEPGGNGCCGQGGTEPSDQPYLLEQAGIEPPMAISQPQPEYPALAKPIGMQGSVKLLASLGRDGTIESIEVLRDLPLLTPAAISAVKRWTYKPARLNGVPVRVSIVITINFRLK